MKNLKRLLLLLSLSPIIFSFYVASLNFNKVSNLKILIWESQQQRIGLLFILGSSLGFTLSSLNIVLATNDYTPNRRKVIRTIDEGIKTEDELNSSSDFNKYTADEAFSDQEYFLERDLREPSPTISVPYKIISKPTNVNLRDKANVQENIGNFPRTKSSQVDNSNKNPENSLIDNDWSLSSNEDW